MGTHQPSRSAMLVAACRLIADESEVGRTLCHDPYADLFVDEDAVEGARRSPALARSVWLRTRYIDDAVLGFVADHPDAQVLLLGAGNDSRAVRLGLEVDLFEVDLPATVAAKEHVLATAGVRAQRRHALPVDLRSERIVEPLSSAGFDPTRPTVAVWEGVTMYLSEDAVAGTFAQLAEVVAPGGLLVVDYVRRRSFDRGFRGESGEVRGRLDSGGEPLEGGLSDAAGTLGALGFAVLDESAVEDLLPRYGLPPVDRREMPLRILSARRLVS